MTNRLVHETSPYLLQHAENPVDWYPWGEEALQKARAEDKPTFLSIGWSACDWCQVHPRNRPIDRLALTVGVSPWSTFAGPSTRGSSRFRIGP